MTVVRSAAHLKICECGIHGNILTASGSQSSDFASKVAGLLMMHAGMALKLITREELPELERQIRESNLPTTNAEADRRAVKHVEMATTMTIMVIGGQPENLTDLLTSLLERSYSY